MKLSDIGLIGLAVMGQNLVLNMEGKGYSVSVYNRTAERTKEFMSGAAKGRKGITAAYTLEDFVTSLARPRKIIIMVKAGQAVDGVIDKLVPLLDKGDIVMDGGNSYFKDTVRRARELENKGIHFMGVGVSGGEEGALKGPSIMPGGSKSLEPGGRNLKDISAKVGGVPCCDYIGADGAGHYVKMVHNGIEYGDIQLISEAYFLMKELLGLTAKDMQAVFQEWNRGQLNSYLIEITADILGRTDDETGQPMVDVILDRAGHKGTGKWTSQEGLELGAAIPTIAEAVLPGICQPLRSSDVAASKKF